ncbi:MAG: dialkylresorcinol condensing enzyme [Actinomycetota bacterium]|nr:dialkylresorcinol condensing enzyme [Actinomycetota bacterium]
MAESVAAPLEEAGVDVRWARLTPAQEFPFPWDLRSFMSVFPDTVTGRGCDLAPAEVPSGERFDLVVVAYTVWFLSPSLPVQAFFDSPLREVLRDTPVVSLIACRNMWLSAEREVRRLVRDAGGLHAGTIAVTDEGPPWATFITTPRWLLTGRRDRFLRIFPPAGISDATIGSLRRFGEALADRRERLTVPEVSAALAGLDPIQVDRPMVLPDLAFGRMFRGWAAAIERLTRPGTAGRGLALGALTGFIVTAVVGTLSSTVVLRLLARRQAERLTDRYLDRFRPRPAPAQPPERREEAVPA